MLDILQAGRRAATRFPYCRLHRRAVVDSLPARCPMREPLAHPAIERMLDAAYAELGKHPRPCDRAGALAMLDRAETCYGCIGDNIAHPHIRRLRREAQP